MLSCSPFIALIISHFTTDDEKFSVYKLISVVLGFLGVFILVGDSVISKEIDAIYGQLAVLLATTGYISAGLLIRKLGSLNTIICSTSMLLTASLVMLPFISYVEIMEIKVDTISTISVVFLALVPTAFATLIRVQLVKRVGIQFMSQVAYLIPIFAIFWAWLFLSELPNINAWIALVLILAGLIIRKIKE